MPTHSPWQHPLDAGRYDVAVVGGGVMGAGTAWALRQMEPSLRVALVEAKRLAHGASGRNAGFVLPGTHRDYGSSVEAYGREAARRLWRFTVENAEALASELDPEAFDYTRSGSLVAAGTPEEAERLRRSAVLLAEDGVAAEYLDADGANAVMQARGFYGALAVSTGGTLHPQRLVRHLTARSEADVLEGWPVMAIQKTTDGLRLVSEDGATLVAGRVVLALNAYLPRLVPELGRFARPVRAQMLATSPVEAFLERPVYSHEGFFYLRQTGDGRLLVGGARHLHLDDEVGYEDRTTDALQADVEAYLRAHFPRVGVVAVERRWSGTMGFSPDGLPVVGEVPGVEGAVWAAGFTGHGMGFGVRFGRLLARRVLGLPDEADDLFGAERLDAARPDYRAAILALIDDDERVRTRLAADGSLYDGYHPEMEAVHRKNAARLGEIIAEVGWPGRTLVGERAAAEAWRIAQHAISDPHFQREALRLVEGAIAQGEVPAWQAAYLDDRIRLNEGRPQRYGTQFDWNEDGRMSLYPPVEEPESVDARRAAVGLPPLAEAVEVQRAAMAGSNERPPSDLGARRRGMDEWARRLGWRT